MNPEIEHKRQELSTLCRRYGVTRLEVFGSAARGTDFDPGRSDLDFLAAFEPAHGMSAITRHCDFAEELERLFGRPVDVVERKALDESRNYIRRRSILKDAAVVYG